MQSLFTLFLLFGLPFFVLPFGASYFESPKVIIAELVILLLALSYFLKPQEYKLVVHKKSKLLKGKSPRIKASNLISRAGQIHFTYLSLVLGIGVFSVYHLMFSHSESMLLGNAFRGQGTLMLWTLLLFSVIVSSVTPLRLPRWLVLIVLLIQLLLSVFIEAKDGRAIGTLGEPNSLAAFAIFLWPLVLIDNRIGWKKWLFSVGALLLCGVVIIFSGSRSGAIALAIQLIFLLLARFTSLTKATIIAVVLIICSLIPPVLDTATVYENRGEIWWTALVAGYEHPITGWGFGNVEVAFEEYNTKLYNRLRGYYVDSSHNFLLDWWVQGGLIGLSFIVIVLVTAVRNAISKRHKRELVVLLGLITVMSFNPMSVVVYLYFWWVIGRTSSVP